MTLPETRAMTDRSDDPFRSPSLNVRSARSRPPAWARRCRSSPRRRRAATRWCSRSSRPPRAYGRRGGRARRRRIRATAARAGPENLVRTPGRQQGRGSPSRSGARRREGGEGGAERVVKPPWKGPGRDRGGTGVGEQGFDAVRPRVLTCSRSYGGAPGRGRGQRVRPGTCSPKSVDGGARGCRGGRVGGCGHVVQSRGHAPADEAQEAWERAAGGRQLARAARSLPELLREETTFRRVVSLKVVSRARPAPRRGDRDGRSGRSR